MKFNEYVTNYLKEYLGYPQHSQVLDFIKFLKEKEVVEINDANFSKLIAEFGRLDLHYVNDFYSEFLNDLRKVGIEINLYN